METTTIKTTNNGSRQVAVNALAIVGFIVLVILGMVLAVYAASFVPTAVSRIGSAAVYLSSSFTSGEDTGLEVVTPNETVPLGDDVVAATSTATTDETVTPAATPTTPATTPVRPGVTTTTTYPTGTTVAVPAALSGLPDLAVEITAIGYLNTSNTNSFVRSSEIPDGKRGAVKFAIVNRGTNVSGSFKFDAKLPTTSSSYTFTSATQQSLRPNDRIDYVLGFDKTKSGDDREIRITVDADKDIRESNENNNTDTETVDIEK